MTKGKQGTYKNVLMEQRDIPESNLLLGIMCKIRGCKINSQDKQVFFWYTLSTPYRIKRIQLAGNIGLKMPLFCLFLRQNGHI
jgi:hypothetical protein